MLLTLRIENDQKFLEKTALCLFPPIRYANRVLLNQINFCLWLCCSLVGSIWCIWTKLVWQFWLLSESLILSHSHHLNNTYIHIYMRISSTCKSVKLNNIPWSHVCYYKNLHLFLVLPSFNLFPQETDNFGTILNSGILTRKPQNPNWIWS